VIEARSSKGSRKATQCACASRLYLCAEIVFLPIIINEDYLGNMFNIFFEPGAGVLHIGA
jgi:hypothetical protein